MTSNQDPITPIASSGEEEYQKYNSFDNIVPINETDETTHISEEKQNQKQLNDNLRILQRQRGVEQLITSEEKYCNSLKKLITLYFEPLSSHLSLQNQFILFGDIKTIFQKNAQFSIALEQKYKTFNPSTTLIADDINKYFNPDLRSLYQNYVNRHEEATKLLSSLQTDSKFVKICDEAQSKYKKTRNLDSQSDGVDLDIEIEITNHLKHLLLLPIHRISKYESIIKDIINNTDESHGDYANLNQCLCNICSINQLISDKMKEFSEREVVRKIANAIKGNESLKLETPYRKFIKNGYLIKMGKTKPQRYLFFLFNDLLFYCKKIGHDNININKAEMNNNNNMDNIENEHEKSDSKSNSIEEEIIKDKVINLSTATMSKVAHDYSDTSDLHEITSLFGDINKGGRSKSRKSRTKLFSDPDGSSQSDPEDISMTSFGMNIDIHNEIDVYGHLQAHFKVHNLMPIDAAFSVSDFRIHPQRYENKAFEIRSSVKSFIVVAESDRSKKEWMMLLDHCTNQLFQLSLKTNALSLNLTNKKSNNVLNKQKRFAATLYLPTNFTEQCMKCVKQFGYSRRKNHCHHCGLLVCSKCLSEKLPSLQINQINSLKAPNTNKSKSNTTSKVCNDCYTKNKHLFPEFEEASALSTHAKSKIFLYKQKSKQKSKRKKKGKKSKFKKLFKTKSNLKEDAEHDDFYEKGSLKDGAQTKNNNTTNNDAENPNQSDGSDGSDDSYELSENEPSMLSIPENDDHIETLIGHNDYEPSVSSHLAPHWTPHATATTSGHHNRDFSHNLNESGYADNDNDSDSDEIQDANNQQLLSPKDGKLLEGDLTPPVSDSDIPVSPYYDDTPLMDGKGSSDTFEYSPPLSPTGGKLQLRPTNSLNMGNVLDELEREQQERREEEDFGDDDEELVENKKPQPPSRQSSLLRAIPEYEDTDEETSANDVDAATAYEHMRNLSTHIEDQEYLDLSPPITPLTPITPPDDMDDNNIDHTSIIYGNLKIKIQRNGSQYSEPGNTPPPISPRYKNPHKRRLSDKLDKFFNERTGAQQLVQKQILYTTPEQDIEALKIKIQIKREQRDKIKKRLKRKLSHDFRPTEKDIEDRGIKIVPQMIRSDEEDSEEEIIVYDNVNDRNSFSLQKKKSIKPKNEIVNKKKSDIDEGDYAIVLQEERQRNSKKIKDALIERPTPSDMIEKGYISAENINNHIPPMNHNDLIDRLKAELKLQIIDNNNYKIEKEKIIFREKRRHKILTFYDNYLFNYIFDDDDHYPVKEQSVDIDMDYQQILDFVENDLAINSQEISLEKEWMRNLRKRKFQTYINKNKYRMKQTKRDMIGNELNELNQQLELVENTQKIDKMTNEVYRLEQERVVLIENTSKQIDALRSVIRNLNKLRSKQSSFISVS